MSSSPATVVSLPGLAGYRFGALQIEQRDRPVPGDEGYHHWGSFRLDTPSSPARLLVAFESKPGPLRWALPQVGKNAFQMGTLGTCVIWLTLPQPVSGKVSFAFNSVMPTRLAQILLAAEESAALPWPPPKPGPETWGRKQASFSVMGPTATDGRWSVQLKLDFDGKALPAEFLVACNCPREELEVMESSDSPRGAGCLIEPGPDAMSLIITVCPTSRVNYDHISLRLLRSEAFRVETVERLFRP